MVYDYNKEYETIISAFDNNNLLEASLENPKNLSEIHFQEVGYLGRIWRAIISFLTQKNGFENCNAIRVASRVTQFVKNYQDLLKVDKIENLIERLSILSMNVSGLNDDYIPKTHYIGLEIRQIKD